MLSESESNDHTRIKFLTEVTLFSSKTSPLIVFQTSSMTFFHSAWHHHHLNKRSFINPIQCKRNSLKASHCVQLRWFVSSIFFCVLYAVSIDHVAFSAAYICLNMPRVFWTMQRTCNILDPRFSVCFAHFVACYRERSSHPLSICGVFSRKAFAVVLDRFSASFLTVLSRLIFSPIVWDEIWTLELYTVCMRNRSFVSTSHLRFRVFQSEWCEMCPCSLSKMIKISEMSY